MSKILVRMGIYRKVSKKGRSVYYPERFKKYKLNDLHHLFIQALFIYLAILDSRRHQTLKSVENEELN